MITRLFLGVFLSMGLLAPASAEPVEIEQFIQPDGILSAKISPDGRHIAAILYDGFSRTLNLIDTSNLEYRALDWGKNGETGLWIYEKEPREVTWAGNDAIAVDYGLEAQSIDLAGKTIRSLGEEIIGPAEYGQPASSRLLVFTDAKDREVAVCDGAHPGKCSRFSTPRGKPIKWALDKGGKLRAVSMLNSEFWNDVTTVTNWYRASDKDEWVKLAEFAITDDYWIPLYAPDTPGKLVILSRQGRDTYALFDYDVRERRQGEMLAGHPTEDIVSFEGIDQAAFNYVATGGMVPAQVWFDPAWARMQKTVDAQFPNRINLLSGDPARCVLILSYGDVDPGTWYFFDVQQRRMVKIGKVRNSVDPAKMHRMEVTSYAARDGLNIPAYLTRPEKMQGPAPMVVMIHGGPRARDTWSWDAEVQLLASRGYLVFQPQFRGSSGFGRKFEEAGFGQWGKTMQDDITDGVEYVVRQKLADPRRICIVGASYGGFAALWGLVRTPDLYKCGVSFAGVVDIGYMLSDSSDTSKSKIGRQVIAREVMLSQIADKKMRSELFDPVSPLKHAAEIKVPVLLAHGKEDERVPISHSEKMKEALERNGKQVRLMKFDEEGHGLAYTKHKLEYYTALLEFLDRNIGH